jgi:hypothetical protein
MKANILSFIFKPLCFVLLLHGVYTNGVVLIRIAVVAVLFDYRLMFCAFALQWFTVGVEHLYSTAIR